MNRRYKGIMRHGIFPDGIIDNTMLFLKDRDYKTYEGAYRLFISNPSPLTIQYEDDTVVIHPDDDIRNYEYLLDEIPYDRKAHSYFHFKSMAPEKGRGLSERQMLFIARLYERIAIRRDDRCGSRTTKTTADFYESTRYNLVGIPSDRLTALRALQRTWEKEYGTPFDILIDDKRHTEYLLDACAHGHYDRQVRLIPKGIATGRKDSKDISRHIRIHNYQHADDLFRDPYTYYAVYDPAGIGDDGSASLARNGKDRSLFPYLFREDELFDKESHNPTHLNLNFKKI